MRREVRTAVGQPMEMRRLFLIERDFAAFPGTGMVLIFSTALEEDLIDSCKVYNLVQKGRHERDAE